MKLHKEIRDAFKRLNTDIVTQHGKTWSANSQYGIPLAEGFLTRSSAKSHTLRYYAARMHLIRQ